ncbi:9284_t:CDS:2 [Ambispora gerdemannii]|uniref:9284_t:CDS:1 n=1 Tax=Ambispora gerdemannii TaxID=144530 RepID=A0A9N9CP37_9GLOM|nr:9284_t:CDS:2 [Ambispora gerdemannii]
MHISLITTLATCLLTYIVASTSAFTILYPSGKYWVVLNTTSVVRWTYNASSDPPNFSVELQSPDASFPLYAIVTTANSSLGIANWTVQQVPPGTGYKIVFVNIGDINQRYTVSEDFEIKANGSTPSEYKDPSSTTSTGNDTNNSGSGDNKSNNSKSDGNSLSTNARSSFYAYQMTLIVGVVGLVGYFF